jgi:hypothetical protein
MTFNVGRMESVGGGARCWFLAREHSWQSRSSTRGLRSKPFPRRGSTQFLGKPAHFMPRRRCCRGACSSSLPFDNLVTKFSLVFVSPTCDLLPGFGTLAIAAGLLWCSLRVRQHLDTRREFMARMEVFGGSCIKTPSQVIDASAYIWSREWFAI